MDATQKLLLSPAEAARMLGICDATLRRLKTKGMIPHVATGGA
jgi:excisionase family DNA binding protein